MLSGKDITVRYGERVCVDQVCFSLEVGQWLMLVGPNGAGKSSLINAIVQSVPYTGSITLEGRDVRAYKPTEFAKIVGVLSQQHHVGYAYTVEEVVNLGRYAHSRSFLSEKDEGGAQHVEDALRLTGMSDMRHQSILTLSGGELQRTFLAQVFAQNPRLLILDEPANHLDLVYQKHIFSLIREWLKTPGRAVMSVVHDLSLARMYGTHAILMHEGRCIAQGTIDAVFARENLRKVYEMDVYAWMCDMLKPWQNEI